MKKISFILLLSLIAVATFAQKKSKKSKQEQKTEVKSSASNDKVLFRYNLKKGETYEQAIESDMKMQMMGMNINMMQKMATKTTVSNVDASGNLTQETSVEKYYVKQETPMGTMEYDSEDPSKQPTELAAELGKMKGKKTTTKMTSSGKILEAPQDANITNSAQFPEQAIGIGDTWETTVKNFNPALGKEITAQNKYKFLERNNGKAIFEINGKMFLDNKEVGTVTGKMTVDEKTGLTLDANLSQKMKMEVQGSEMQLEGTTKIAGKKL